MSEEEIPIYSQYERYSPECWKQILTAVLLYPRIAIHRVESSEKKRQIEYEYKSWISYLEDSYFGSGISCNCLIRFVDWSLHYACELIGLKLPTNVQVGVSPIQTMNIHGGPIDENTYCIFIDPSCIGILEDYTRKIFSNKTVGENAAELSEKIKNCLDNSLEYGFEAVVFDGENPQFEGIKAFFFVHTLYFALLHEYAHILNNHVSLNKALIVDENKDTEKEPFFFYNLTEVKGFSVLFKNTFQEFEADAWATYYLTKIIHVWDCDEERLRAKISMSAPILFLGVLQAFETAHVVSGQQIIDRHPAAFDRLTIPDLVLDTLNEGFTDEVRKLVGSQINSVVYKLSSSPGCASVHPMSIWWPIFNFLLSLDENLLIPEVLWNSLDEWENPNLKVMKRTIEEIERRARS